MNRQTYGDKIRSMNDAELAKFLCSVADLSSDTTYYVPEIGSFVEWQWLEEKLGKEYDYEEAQIVELVKYYEQQADYYDAADYKSTAIKAEKTATLLNDLLRYRRCKGENDNKR